MISLFFLMIRRPPRSTLDRSSAASDVYKRQVAGGRHAVVGDEVLVATRQVGAGISVEVPECRRAVSYTHLRAHETVLDLVCRLLLEKKKTLERTNHRLDRIYHTHLTAST